MGAQNHATALVSAASQKEQKVAGRSTGTLAAEGWGGGSEGEGEWLRQLGMWDPCGGELTPHRPAITVPASLRTAQDHLTPATPRTENEGR